MSHILDQFPVPSNDSYWHYVMARPSSFKNFESAKIFSILQKLGEDSLRKSSNGMTPYDVAIAADNKSALAFLKAHGIVKKETVFDPLFQTRHVTLPSLSFEYKEDQDFGVVIKELLFSGGYNDSEEAREVYKKTGVKIEFIQKNMQEIGAIEGFSLKFGIGQYYVRDQFVHLPSGKFAVSHISENLPQAIYRNESKSLVFQDKAEYLTDHIRYQGTVGGAITPHDLAVDDLKTILKSETSLVYYIEGGNKYLVRNRKGKLKILVGKDHFLITLNQFRLDKTFEEPEFADVLETGKGVIDKLTEEQLKQILCEMYVQGLLKPVEGCKKGFINKEQNSLISRVVVTAQNEKKGVNPYVACAEMLGFYEHPQFTEKMLQESKSLAGKYLMQKNITEEVIAQSFQLNAKDIIFVPQLDYHLDVFMRPGPKGSFFVQDFGFSYELLKTIQEKNSLELEDQELLERYLKAAARLSEQLSPLFKKTKETLENAGFIVIPTPGMFCDVSSTKLQTFTINFINSITGFSENTKHYYYIAFGAQTKGKLGDILMDAFKSFLESYIHPLHVYYVGYDPKNPKDFSEAMGCWNRLQSQAGPHCMSFEMATKPHTE